MQNYSAKIMKTGKTLIIPGTHNNTSLTNEKCFPVYFFMHDIISIKKNQKNKLMYVSVKTISHTEL